MNRSLRRFTVAILSAAVAFTMFPTSALAATSKISVPSKGTIVKKSYTFAPHLVEKDLKDQVVYTDQYFSFPGTVYNPHLAVATADYAWASIASQNALNENAAKKQSQNIRDFLYKLGFSNFQTNADFQILPTDTTDSFGVCGAAKKIHVNGADYTLFALSGRNANYLAEWGGNFRIGKGSQAGTPSEGFANGRKKATAFFQQYVKQYYAAHPKAPKKIKLWLNGYSRGAAVGNLTAAYIYDHRSSLLPRGVSLTGSDIYAYLFGTPRPAYKVSKSKAASYKFIHNIYASYDYVTMMPMAGMGFTRYGDWHVLNPGYSKSKGENPTNERKMLSFLKNTNSELYRVYRDGSQNPSAVTVQRFKSDGSMNIEKDTENVNQIPSNLGDYMSSVFDQISSMSSNDRNIYTDKYQTQMMQLVKVIKGDRTGKFNAMVGELKSSSSIQSTGLVALAYYVVNRLVPEGTELTPASLEPLKEQLNQAAYALADFLEKNMDYSVPPDAVDSLKEALGQSLDDLKQYQSIDQVRDNLKAIAAQLFGAELSQAMQKSGFSQQEIDDICGTAPDYTAAGDLLEFVTGLLLSGKNETFNLFTVSDSGEVSFNWNNYQMTHLATFLGMFERTIMAHANEYIGSWLKIQDSYWTSSYDRAGYRTLYLSASKRKAMKITIRSKSSTIKLSVKGSKIKRSDGKTRDLDVYTDVRGNKLRITLPLKRSYKVTVKSAKKKAITIRSAIREYKQSGVAAGKTIRKTKRTHRSLNKIKLAGKGKLVYSLPKAKSDKKFGSAAYNVKNYRRA